MPEYHHPACANVKCGRAFTSHAANSKFCAKPECQKAKVDQWHEARREESKRKAIAVKSVKPENGRHVRLCSEGCGRTTKNYFGKCDECRRIILQGHDFEFARYHV